MGGLSEMPESTNGTYVNGQKIDDASLAAGCRLRVGSTDFEFHEPRADGKLTETVVRDVAVSAGDADNYMQRALKEMPRGSDFVILHRLSCKLISCNDPDEAVNSSLEILYKRTRASVIGFLWVSEEGNLKPKTVIPHEMMSRFKLSDSLTEKVCKKSRAVWIATQTADRLSESLRHFADAICVPIVNGETTIGALHIYLEHRHFDQAEYEFAMSIASMLSAALVRTRQQAVLKAEHTRLVAKSGAVDELIGDSKPMLELKSKIGRIGRASGCVLIRGESGSGKELVARAIHRASPRADRPMLTVNCAAIPRDLVESHLFGHKRGAFTGADLDHVGWFQQADSGTLFLDEIGELPLEGQAKLLRILEGHPFMPVGATKEVRADVRVIAATNRALRDFVRDGRFRDDLYYRMSVFELHLPPLRDRGEDVRLLANHYLEHFKHEHGRPTLTLSDSAWKKLIEYHWPGNVRQLRNVIDSAVVMAEGEQIQPSDLGLRDAGNEVFDTLDLQLWEKKLIIQALDRTHNNVPEAAKLLGIGRATLYRKIEEYGIAR